MASKCIRIASTDILNEKIFLGEDPQTPINKGDIPSSITCAFDNRLDACDVPWPYHFQKADDGPNSSQCLIMAGVARNLRSISVWKSWVWCTLILLIYLKDQAGSPRGLTRLLTVVSITPKWIRFVKSKYCINSETFARLLFTRNLRLQISRQ